MTRAFAKTPTGKSWTAMMSRCFNKNYNVYQQYGARGITVCKYLQTSVLNLVVLIGTRPEGKTLDRKDNKGNYSCGQCEECFSKKWPMNVRWATLNEQMRNTRLNRIITINGVSKCAVEWSEQSGLTISTILNRVKRGWKDSDLLMPPKDPRKFVEINGIKLCYREWANRLGIDENTFSKRIACWPKEFLALPKQKPRAVRG